MNTTRLLCFAFVSIGFTSATFAASTDTWVGGTGNNFSTTANWTYSSGSGPVASGDSLVFSGAGSTAPNNDNTGFTYNAVTFNGTTAYTIGGNSFTLGSGGSIANNGAVNQTINNNIGLTGTGGTLSPAVASAAITVGGIISGSANLTKAGNTTGTLTLNGVNTFSGVLNLNAGIVVFSTPPSVSGGNLGNPSSITFGGSSTTTLQTSTTAGAVTISSPTITVNTSSTASIKNGASSGTFEISAKVTGAGNCRQNSPTTTGAVVRFSNDTSDFTGIFTMAAGVVEFTSVANGGSASSLGAGSSAYVIANSSSAATLRYVGSGNTSTTRNLDWQATTGGLTIDSGTTASGPVISFLGTGNLRSANGIITLTLSGASTGANTLAQVINDGTTGSATSVTKSGTGLWILTGANTYSGGTTLSSSGGTLGIGNASALGSGALTIGGASTSFDNVTGGPIAIANGLTCSGGSPTYVGSTNMTINGPTILSAANRTITVNASSLTLGGVVSESGSRQLTKAGIGTLALAASSANTYSGGTVVSAGTLQLSGSATLGSSGSALTVSGGMLDLGGTSQTPGTVTISGACLIQNGTLTGSSYAGTLSSGMATVSAVLAGGSATLNQSGAGSLLLLGANTYNGGSTISGAGTLVLTNDSGLGNSTAGLSFSANGALAATNNGAAANNPVTIGSSRTVTISSGITGSFICLDTNNLILAAKITGAGNVTKKSSSFSLGNVRFSNDANDYTGDFTAGFGNAEFTSVADQGTVSSLGVGAAGTGGQININNVTSSGTLRYVGSGNSATHRPLNWTGTTGTYTLEASGGGTIQFLNSANLKTSGSGNEELRLRGTNTGGNTIAQAINDSGGTTWVNKFDAGTWVLSGTNTFSGAVTNSGGVLQVNAVETPGTSGPLGKTGTLWFAGGTLQYSAANNYDYSSRFSIAPSQAFKIDCNGQSVTFATALTNSGGSLAVSSTAAGGRLILSAANTYSGATTVTSGTLLVNGSVAGSGVTISAGTLGGSGAVTSLVNVQSGGTLQPGAGSDIATLAISNNLALAGKVVMLLNRTNTQTASRILGITTLTNGGTLTVTNAGDALQAGDSFTLFSASSYVGSFSATNLPSLTGNLAWDLSQLSVNGTISVQHAPTAGSTTGRTIQNQPFAISAAKLLLLCSDPDNDSLTIVSAGPASTNGGTVSLTSTNITYQPFADFVGTDLFNYTVSDGRGGSATGSVLMTVVSSNSSSPNVVSGPSILPNGHFHVGFAGIPGRSYTVQYSANVNGPWTMITNLTADSIGLFDFEDPTEPAPPTRFYRTVYP